MTLVNGSPTGVRERSVFQAEGGVMRASPLLDSVPESRLDSRIQKAVVRGHGGAQKREPVWSQGPAALC